MNKVDIDTLATEIISELQNYSDEIAETLKKEVKSAAKDAKKSVGDKSPIRTGKYKRSWGVLNLYESKEDIRIAVRNKEYQLTHLLEHGHLTRSGKRTRAIPHVLPTELEVEQKLLGKLKVKIRNG